MRQSVSSEEEEEKRRQPVRGNKVGSGQRKGFESG
jgi:hypothetical protein